MGEDKDSKTEKATPKKRRDERKKGNVFMSKDAVAVATLFASIVMLRVTFSNIVGQVELFIQYIFTLVRTAPESSAIAGMELFKQGVALFVKTAGPLLLVTALVTVVATFAQTRFLVSAELMKPKLSRINPLQGFKRLFSMRSLVEALKNVLKIGILLYLIYSCTMDLIQVAANYMYADLTGASIHLLNSIFSMMLKVALAFLVLAAADFMYQWYDYEKQLRMSKQEIKEEYKQTEGDPQIKGKIKQLQRQMSQSRMMQQVPGADVVVRNPTHVAVALRYHSETDTAPIVLAKGQDVLAMRIVEVAEEHNIPTMENVPLAHALYNQVEVNSVIPPSLYEAVAEVLVYVYRLEKKDLPERHFEDGDSEQTGSDQPDSGQLDES